MFFEIDVDDQVTDLEEKLDNARAVQKEMRELRDNDFREYLASLIYAKEMRGGSYGYTYGEFGDTERRKADKVIEVAQGNPVIAENIVREYVR